MYTCNKNLILEIFLLHVYLDDLKGSRNNKYFQYLYVTQMKDLVNAQLLVLDLVDFQ